MSWFELCAARVSDTAGYMGGEWAALPPSVAVLVSVGFTVQLVLSAFLGPGAGDYAAGCRPPTGSFSGGRSSPLNTQKPVIITNMMTKVVLKYLLLSRKIYTCNTILFSADVVYMDTHWIPHQWWARREEELKATQQSHLTQSCQTDGVQFHLFYMKNGIRSHLFFSKAETICHRCGRMW